MNNFRTYKLAVKFYKESRNAQLNAMLRDQLARAASSIVLNLAEGAGRELPKDQRRFYRIAFGSLRECQALLDIMSNPSTELMALADSLGGHLFKLIRSRC